MKLLRRNKTKRWYKAQVELRSAPGGGLGFYDPKAEWEFSFYPENEDELKMLLTEVTKLFPWVA